jgi:hypothetical protein
LRTDVVEETIKELWRSRANTAEYVGLEEVEERLHAKGIETERSDLAEEMRRLAVWRGWDLVETFGDTVSVYLD